MVLRYAGAGDATSIELRCQAMIGGEFWLARWARC